MEYLYVCQFSNGLIKVGRSIEPESRIASHADRVAVAGIELITHRRFMCSDGVVRRESALISRCRELASESFKSEWFQGLQFDDVCNLAERIANDDALRTAPTGPEIALNEAIEACPTLTVFADRIGVAQSTVSMWRKRGGAVPAEHCPAIERETGVKCERLNPSVAWGVLREQAAESASASA